MRRIMTTVVVAAMLASVAPVFGGTTGYTAVTVPGNSTAAVSMPFVNKAEGTFEVATDNTLQVSGSPFTGEDYSDMYYVRVTDGDTKGRWSTIASNTAGEIVLKDTSFIGDIAAGDKFKVVKHVTLSQAFPDALRGISFRESGLKTTIVFGNPVVSLDQDNIGTRVIAFPDPSVSAPSIGPNKVPSRIYVYGDGSWRNTGSIGTSADDDILPPDQYFFVRNSTSDEKLTFIPSGNVSFEPKAVQLVSDAGSDNDVVIGGTVKAIKLKDLALGGTSAFVDSVITTTIVFGNPVTTLTTKNDQLLVFGATGDVPQKVYVYADGHWRNTSAIGTVADDDEIPASGAFIIRKVAGSSTTEVWVNSSL